MLMTLKYRRSIYIIFVLLFIGASIWLLLTSQGYVYNYTKNRFEQTGSLKIKTDPSGAHIILNGNKISANTPATIKKLLPDSYEIKLQLAGFQEYLQKTEVSSGQLTQATSIKLWPQTQTGIKLTEHVDQQSTLSPNKNLLAYTISSGLNSGLWLLNLTSSKTILLQRTSTAPIDFIEWSPRSDQLLLRQEKNNWTIYNLTNNTSQPLEALNNFTATIAHWSENDNNIIYFATDQEIYELNIANNKTGLLWRVAIQDLRHHKNIIYALVKEGAGVFLRLLNLKNLQIIPLSTEIPGSTGFIFLPAHNNRLPLLDTNKHTLYLLTSPLTDLKPVTIMNEAINIEWLASTNKLLLSNNYEVWLYDLDKDKKTLIYRVSQPLQLARWFNENYLLLITGKDLLVLTIDTLNQQQKWLLSNQPTKIDEILVDPNHDHLLILTAGKIIQLDVNSPAVEIPGKEKS